MQQENLEQQAVDCVESIGYCVNDIRAIVLDRLQQIQELQNNMDKMNEKLIAYLLLTKAMSDYSLKEERSDS